MTALRATASTGYTAPAAAKTIAIPASGTGGTVAVGDVAFLQWSGGAAPTSGTPAGWTQLASGQGGTMLLWYKLLQAGDLSSTITAEPGGGASKVALTLTILSSVDQVTPISKSGNTSESVSQTTHTGPALSSVTTTGKVLQFYFSKDTGTASSTRTPSGSYTLAIDKGNGSAANQQTGTVYISNSDVTGTIGASTWTADQATAAVFMVAVAVGPVSTTVGVFPQTDVTLPGGTTVTGGTTAAQVLGDNDDNTFAQFGISGSAVHLIERFGTSGVPLQGPLQSFTLSVKMNGATSVVVVPTLRNGTTPINAQASHTFSADGSFTWTISSPDQAAQVDLTNVQVDFSITGS